jgi:dihydrofolate synthase/folylpolyglutamate synthase
METLFKGRKAVFVVGAMADKDIDGMFAKIVPFADVFYTVTPNNDRALDAERLAERLNALGAAAIPCGSFSNAVDLALSRAGKDGVVAAIGSLYFSSDIRKAYEKHVKGI